MLNTETVREFFDRCAPNWDAEMIRDDEKIRRILDHACVLEGADVLDVATGTGVLIPDYLKRGVSSVTAIDLSPEMIRLARKKISDPRVRFLTGDAMTEDLGGPFDVIMIYNAFPHFGDPEGLIDRLFEHLKPGGTLSVAHGSSREEIDRHHEGSARAVSMGLMPAEDLAALFKRRLTVTVVISDESMYQVVGQK